MSYYYHNRDMVGDLRIVGFSRWSALGYTFWYDRGFRRYWRGASAMVYIQRKLHEPDGEENEIVLKPNSKYWARNWARLQTPYHADILPHWNAFAAAKQNTTGLTRVQIHNVELPPSPFFGEKLMPVLKNNQSSLISLEFDSCNLASNEVALIAGFITASSVLTTLSLAGSKIDTDNAQLLSTAMKDSTLSFANLSKCSIGSDVEVLSTLLDGVGNLKGLMLEENDIGSDDDDAAIALIAAFLAGNETLTVFSLQCNAMSAENTAILSRGLKINTKLRELALGGNCRLELPTILRKCVTANLTYMDLTCSRLNTNGTRQVTAFLERNPALRGLNLANNGIRPANAADFVAVLKKNTNLEHLNCSRNYFNGTSIPILADGLKNNTTLLSFDLSNNKIKLAGKKDMIRIIACDTTSLSTIADSNHTCQLIMTDNCYKSNVTHEKEMRNISKLENEGQKIRYKVVLALFAFGNEELFNPAIDDLPLELMPRLLEIVQQEVGYNGYGKGVVDKIRKTKSKKMLKRLYELVHGSPNLPLLFVRGPGKPRKKRKRKQEVDEDEDWTPKSRVSSSNHREGRTSLARTLKKSTNYCEN